MKTELSIIIINFNTLKLTQECLRSIIKNADQINYEVIIINNHPQTKQRDAKKLKKIFVNFKNIKIIKAQNHGFGAANNLGARIAKGKILFLLNSDTLVLKNSIKKMTNFLKKHQEIGALNPLLLNPNGLRQKHYFGDFQSLFSVVTRIRRNENLEKNKIFFYRQRVSGAAMMLEKSDFEKVGGFDESFFMYFEDEDLCRRLLNLGKKNAVLQSAKIIHKEGASLNNNPLRQKFYRQSQNYYWLKHYGSFMMLLMKLLRFPYICLKK